jgi:large subunit ribosomal protein L10
MNRDQKAAVIDEVAEQISSADAIFAVDYRGLTVAQISDLRSRLREADARFAVVKNTLTERAADKAQAEGLKEFLAGPTAMTFVKGDAAAAAKALRDFRRASGLPEFKGGWMNGSSLSAEEIDAIAQLPSRDVLYGRLVGMVAAPLTGLASALNGLIGGLARQLAQIADQGLVPAGGATASAAAEAAPEPDPDAEPKEVPEPGPDPDPAPEQDATETASADESTDAATADESTSSEEE